MFDGVATLKAYAAITHDDYGNPMTIVEETTVYVQPRGVYQSEYYNAAQVGLKPSLTLFIPNGADYDGQKYLEYDGREYEVIRTDWNAQRDGLALICEERVRNGSNVSVESE